MLYRCFWRAGAAAFALSVAGCSGDATSASSGETTTLTLDVCASPPPGDELLGQPPPPVVGAAQPASGELVFAATRFFLGQRKLTGEADLLAWEDFGFNLDGAVSEGDARRCMCAATAGAVASSLTDGHDGRDNHFGRELFPILSSLDAETETAMNDSVKAGTFSWILALHGVGAAPAYEGLTAEVYEAAPLVDDSGAPVTPKLDGSDVRPVAFESVNQGDPASPKLAFKGAYTAPGEGGGTVWVGRAKGSIVLAIPFQVAKTTIRLTILDPVLTVPLSADRSEVRGAQIGGTLAMDELEAETTRLLGFFQDLDGNSFCPPSATAQSLLQQIRQAADIRADRSGDPDAPCEQVSIGVAFDAAPAQIGVVAPAAEPRQDLCMK